jgi:DNA-binding HxlR family transcriptional regulator
MSADPDVPWDLVAQVRRSKRKTEIVNELATDPASASELGKMMGIQTASASNYLRDLKNMDPPVVSCITPEQPHHRLYALTEEGEIVYEHV